MPTADVRDLGALLQRAGFALPVADRDVVTVRYEFAFELFRELRAMGATNALTDRDRRPVARGLFLRAAEIYAERFSDPDGRIRATFDIVSLSGWSPHESQQKPARRGSGQVSLGGGASGENAREVIGLFSAVSAASRAAPPADFGQVLPRRSMLEIDAS